jgi:hypothetical protein
MPTGYGVMVDLMLFNREWMNTASFFHLRHQDYTYKGR